MSLARWSCPKCGGGRLAPRRARLDDIRRYCLGCSEQTGRLVERVCKVAEKARERQRSKREVNRVLDRLQARTAAASWPYSLQEEWSRMQELPTARYFLRHPIELTILKHVPVRRLGTSYGGRVSIRIGGKKADDAQLRATMLHELAHEIVNVRRRAKFQRTTYLPSTKGMWRTHGMVFHSVLKDLLEEYTGLSAVRIQGGTVVEDQVVALAARHAVDIGWFLRWAMLEPISCA